ncbi:hypothetical protein BWQ27_21040 [Salmonella enterica subsp. enterica serovar Pensacola]|uniref:Uncharacterized protein n=1 Tax=Salmonella enterica subsp. enterica serovar Pensacola TaxID=34042 RepID=A0A602ZAQ6_SALET|nr:hypothetical protein [Salmonella enterica subsp. enterica serovar Pensacola]
MSESVWQAEHAEILHLLHPFTHGVADITPFQPAEGAVSPAHDGVDKQPGGMDMQVKAPGNVDGGHRPFFPVNPQHNLVFQLFFFFRGQWSGTDGCIPPAR